MTASPEGAEILAVAVVTPVGLDAASAAAAVRAGVSRVRESSIYDRHLEPHRMALVPEDALPQLAEPLRERGGMTSAHARLVRLAGAALGQLAEVVLPSPAPLFMGLREAPTGEPDPVGESFLADLATQADAQLDVAASRLFREGGAAGLYALRAAVERLQGQPDAFALVGGVDTFLDLRRLALLDAEGRILGERVMDGFVPGEGAAVLLLAPPAAARKLGANPLARVVAVGTGEEPGHRYSDEPYRGEGLAGAIQAAFAAAPSAPPVRCVYAGFNGESLPAKEWGVGYLRSTARFAPGFAIEHPGDCLGDTGAAAGPIMLGLATVGIRKGYRAGPCLVWCTSDRAPRAAALLQAAS